MCNNSLKLTAGYAGSGKKPRFSARSPFEFSLATPYSIHTNHLEQCILSSQKPFLPTIPVYWNSCFSGVSSRGVIRIILLGHQDHTAHIKDFGQEQNHGPPLGQKLRN